MGTFIVDGATELPAVKSDTRAGSGATDEWAAADANDIRTALLDLRTAVLSVLSTSTTVTTLTYSASMTPDISLGNVFIVKVTNSTAFTLNAPVQSTAANYGNRITIILRNSSGGSFGSVSWNVAYCVPNPPHYPGNGYARSYEFIWNGDHWIEVFESAYDVSTLLVP